MPPPSRLRSRGRPRPGPAALSKSIEIFSEDFKLLRFLLLVNFALMAVFVSKALDRVSSVQQQQSYPKTAMWAALAESTLTTPTRILITTWPRPEYNSLEVELVPPAGGQKIPLALAVAQALDYLVDQGVYARNGYFDVASSNAKASFSLRVAGLTWRNPMYLDAHRQAARDSALLLERPGGRRAGELRELEDLLHQRCPQRPSGVELRVIRSDLPLPQLADKPTHRLRVGGGVSELAVLHSSLPLLAKSFQPTDQLRYFLLRDTQAVHEPLQCERMFVPFLYTEGRSGPDELMPIPSAESPDLARVLEPSLAAVAKAQSELESSSTKVLEGIEVTGGALLMLVPPFMLFILFAISLVLRRLRSLSTLSTSMRLALFGLPRVSARLSPVDGRVLRWTERGLRAVALSVPVLATPLALALSPWLLLLPARGGIPPAALVDTPWILQSAELLAHEPVWVLLLLASLAVSAHILWLIFAPTRPPAQPAPATACLRIERPSAGDFPFYRGQPVAVSGARWVIVLASVALGFAALAAPMSWSATTLGGLARATLFFGMPLAALALAAGGAWTAIFRRPRLRDLGWVIGLALLNIVVTALVTVLARGVVDLNVNPVGQMLVGAPGDERFLFFLGTLPQLFGEELVSVLLFLALLWLCHGRLGLSRGRSLAFAWLGAALVFGALHLPSYGWDLARCFVVIGSARLVLLAGYVATKNIWVSTGAHVVNDWLLIGVLLLTQSAGEVRF